MAAASWLDSAGLSGQRAPGHPSLGLNRHMGVAGGHQFCPDTCPGRCSPGRCWGMCTGAGGSHDPTVTRGAGDGGGGVSWRKCPKGAGQGHRWPLGASGDEESAGTSGCGSSQSPCVGTHGHRAAGPGDPGGSGGSRPQHTRGGSRRRSGCRQVPAVGLQPLPAVPTVRASGSVTAAHVTAPS